MDCPSMPIFAGWRRRDQVDRGPLGTCGRMRARVVPLHRPIQCRRVTYQPVRTSMRLASVPGCGDRWPCLQ